MEPKKIGLGLAAFAVGATAWIVATGRYGHRLSALLRPNPAEHVPTDLLSAHPPGPADRAPDAFRPDPTAVPTAEERESLRPATGPAPGFAADRGSTIG